MLSGAVPTWQAWCHKLSRLLDPDITDDAKLQIASEFLSVPACCLDGPFTARLRQYMQDCHMSSVTTLQRTMAAGQGIFCQMAVFTKQR